MDHFILFFQFPEYEFPCDSSGSVKKIIFLFMLLSVMILCGCTSDNKTSQNQQLPVTNPSTGEILKVGDILTFGSYEQDNDPNNGAEPVEWQVLSVENGRALVISRYALDAKPYNDTYINVTWRSSTLRKWLNTEFYNSAFSAEEKSRIPEMKIDNPNSRIAHTWGGPSTKDRIFLLSFDEAAGYFADDEAQRCEATAYAKANGAYVAENGSSWWWLRSPGSSNHAAAVVLYIGYATGVGHVVTAPTDTVRPALWLDFQPGT